MIRDGLVMYPNLFGDNLGNFSDINKLIPSFKMADSEFSISVYTKLDDVSQP